VRRGGTLVTVRVDDVRACRAKSWLHRSQAFPLRQCGKSCNATSGSTPPFVVPHIAKEVGPFSTKMLRLIQPNKSRPSALAIYRPRHLAGRSVGTAVYNQLGEHLGSVYNLMIDKYSGQVAYAVMAFGGFLSMGESYHQSSRSL
jgi:hypothetical protein